METDFKSGFVALLGPTNSGKSSLLNALVGQKLSIVTPKAQTTYHRICGVVNFPSEQIVFVDTPGFQDFPEVVARLLNRVADRGGDDCDVFVWVFDVSVSNVASQVERLGERIKKRGGVSQTICVLNKIDKLFDKRELLPLIKRIDDLRFFSEIVPLSVTSDDGLDRLMGLIRARLSKGPRFFPEDMVTDRSEQFLVSELVRESIYFAVAKELPYCVRVEIAGWEKGRSGMPMIRVSIHVDSDSRKAILIGKKGLMLKEIGTQARRQIERLLGCQVYLELHVDVEEEWRRDGRTVDRYLELS